MRASRANHKRLKMRVHQRRRRSLDVVLLLTTPRNPVAYSGRRAGDDFDRGCVLGLSVF